MKCSRPISIDRNGLQPYLRAVTDETLLTPSEECILGEAIARGDRNALGRLIQANLRLVVKIAQEYVGKGVLLDDLIGEGNVGLVRAAEQFHPRYGTRFSTYASLWIKQSIRQALFDSTSMIRLPAHVQALMGKWRKAERSLGRELARTPSFSEVAQSLGLSEIQKMLMVRAKQARQFKLESAVAEETGRWSPVESCDPYGPADLAVESLDDQRLLRSRMDALDARERIILTMRFGLEDEKPMSLKEVGSRLGVSREWVRKFELRAIRKLRGELHAVPKSGSRRRTTTPSRRRAGKPAAPRARSSKQTAKSTTRRRSVAAELPRALPAPPSVPAAGAPCIWNFLWPPMIGPTASKQVDSFSNA